MRLAFIDYKSFSSFLIFIKQVPSILPSIDHLDVPNCLFAPRVHWYNGSPIAKVLEFPASARDFPVVDTRCLANSESGVNLILNKSSNMSDFTLSQLARLKFETREPWSFASAGHLLHGHDVIESG